MHKKTWSRWLVLLLFALCACGEKAGVFDRDDNVEKKPDSVYSRAGADGLGALGREEAPKVAATVMFHVVITLGGSFQPCTGEARVEIMTDFKMNFPSLIMNCFSLEFDVSALMKFLSPNIDVNTLSSDGMVLSVSEFGGAKFSPPRPLLLGPVFQDIDKYRNFKKTTTHKAVYTDPSTGEVKESQGQITMEVLELNGSFRSEFINEPFEKTIHWQMTAQGFDGIPGADTILFSKMEFIWNTRPIMVPKLIIEGTPSQLTPSAITNKVKFLKTLNKIGDLLVGKIHIELTAKAYDVD